LGRALALAYAAEGVTLFLGGRDAARLEDVGAACAAAGAEVGRAAVDVTDAEAVRDWIAHADRRRPLDLVIANAGISAGTGGGGEDEAQTRRIFAVNLDGVVNTVLPAVSAMRGRRRGQIGIVSSLAGFRGVPGAPAYCGSKAAVRSWGEALRGAVHRDGLEVCVICPGFVRTPMTDVNRYSMPFLMDADRAARLIRRGLARNRGRIAFPLPMYAVVWLFAALPAMVIDPILRRLPEKD